VDFVFTRVQIIQQSLRVKRARRARDGNKNFHYANLAASTDCKQAAGNPARPESGSQSESVSAIMSGIKNKKKLKQLESAFAFRTIGACSNLRKSFFVPRWLFLWRAVPPRRRCRRKPFHRRRLPAEMMR
jgi:hypothetical protein